MQGDSIPLNLIFLKVLLFFILKKKPQNTQISVISESRD